MIIFNQTIKDRIKDFYFGELMAAFPEKAHDTIKAEYHKHLFELSLILRTGTAGHFPAHKTNGGQPENVARRLLDIGGGLGINAIILTKLFGYQCTVVDRLEEFRTEHQRVVGDKKALVERLARFGVQVDEVNFMQHSFPYPTGSFSVITCFSVIEHLLESPRKLIARAAELLGPSGILIVGTPNQVHLYNRIKVVFGKNTWEDFDYYYSAKAFYGHIRELIPEELAQMVSRDPGLKFCGIVYSNYPLDDHRPELVEKYGSVLTWIFFKTLSFLTLLFPKLNYDMVAIAQKK